MIRAALLVTCILIAGCSDAPKEETAAFDDVVPEGAIRGVVVDQAIVPIEGATVTVVGKELTATTDANGAFAFPDVAPGTYFLEASHPFYDTQQTSVEVTEGTAPITKLQLSRLVFESPYTSQVHLRGYLSCSSNAGGIIAEECGEGAGVPCSAPVIGDVPVIGCQRLGGAPDNVPEATFFTDGGPVKTIQAEVVWEPTLVVGNGIQEGGFTTIMATHFVCDPVCRYEDSLDDKVGHSPLIMRTNDGDQGGSYFTAPDVQIEDANITAETPVSVFIWTSDEDLAAVTFDQPFEVFVTVAYVLPLPEDYVFIEDGAPPF